MATSNFGGGRYQIDVDAAVQSQNQNNNTSTIYARIIVRRISGSGYSTGNQQAWNFSVNGTQIAAGSWIYNFSNYSNQDVWIWSGTWIHNHNADGSATTQNYTGWADMDSGLGRGTAGGSITPASIPRSSSASLSYQPIKPGESVTINTNRASSTFTHDIDWYFGSANGRAVSGAGASASWTPPLSMLQQIPNAAAGQGMIRNHTYSGGSMIGFKDTIFQLEAPAVAVPSVGTATLTDMGTTSVTGTSQNISDLIGAYVQGKSLLKVDFSASGYQGSTIRSRTFSMDGQSASSGGTIQLPSSGSRTLRRSTTDSRSRTTSATQTVTVLAYRLPVASAFNVRRAFLSTGATHSQDENGQYIRVDMTASVQSLTVDSTQKNSIQIRAYTKPRGSDQSQWTARNVINPSGTSYNSFFVISGMTLGVDQSVDVRVEIIDKLDKATNLGVVTTSQIYQHWGPNGVGIAKYHERGALDIGGDVYANGNPLLESGKPTTNWNTTYTPGMYYANSGATGAPWSTDAFIGTVLIDTTGRVAQRLTLLTDTADSNVTWSRVYSGSAWGRWWRSDQLMITPTPATTKYSVDYRSGRYNLLTGSKDWQFNNVFTPEFRRYRIDYSYYTADSNGAWLRLRANGTDESSANYEYQTVYANGSGTPSSAVARGVNVLGFPAMGAFGHFGYIEVSEPMSTAGSTNQKRFQWQDTHSADPNPGNTHGGGWLGQKDTNAYDGFTIALSNTSMNGIASGSLSWIQITAIG